MCNWSILNKLIIINNNKTSVKFHPEKLEFQNEIYEINKIRELCSFFLNNHGRET